MTGIAGRGVLASVAASVLFGAISLLGGGLEGFSPEETTAWRVLLVLAALLPIVLAGSRRSAQRALTARVLRSPRLIIVVLVDAAILGLQLWVFMWGPANGQTQAVALGYFLLPLAMVVVGRAVFRDRLSGWQRAAVLAALVGVVAELVISRSIGWPAVLIVVLYPVYFALRRTTGLGDLHGFLLEVGVLAVVAVPVVVHGLVGHAARGGLPPAFGALLLVAVLSGAAMVLYILASQWLPMPVFGLLSYLEPVLILGAALLLGEHLSPGDAVVYGPVAIALALLACGTLRRRRPSRAR